MTGATSDRLAPLANNNTRVGDFRCADCGEEYELKAGQGAIAGGAAALILLPLREKVAGPAQPGLTDEGSTGPQGSVVHH
ncbi:MAG: hypothetical protein A2623_14855 [Caulobacterales bacterium RIFCSPHIGHO2_01_FULL_70_19]|nr:MAG: hypothetical protein A2623_14855 [Caulobacterales bacterium RIFCSPHIGHO2_01_FULL_70_19]